MPQKLRWVATTHDRKSRESRVARVDSSAAGLVSVLSRWSEGCASAEKLRCRAVGAAVRMPAALPTNGPAVPL